LSVARLVPVKGHVYLIDALYKLRASGIDAKLNLAGDGPLRKELETQTKALGLENHVVFLGAKSSSEIRELFAEADIAILASTSETVGLVNMEGMMSGRPVIATSVLGVPELVEDQSTGFLCPPADSDCLARKVKWILNNPSTSREIVEAGKRRVREQFDREKCTLELIRQWNTWGDQYSASAPKTLVD
jgi:glycosyltransferase involved in cell wall biosynthesis